MGWFRGPKGALLHDGGSRRANDAFLYGVVPWLSASPTYSVVVEDYAGYATPTALAALKNPADSGKMFVIQGSRVLAQATAAATAINAIRWKRSPTLFSDGTPTPRTAILKVSDNPASVAVFETYGADPTPPAVSVLRSKVEALVTAKAGTSLPGTFSMSTMVPATTTQSWVQPETLLPGEMLWIDYNDVAIGAGWKADIDMEWVEVPISGVRSLPFN